MKTMKRVAISLGSIMTALSMAAPVAMADTQHTVQSGETLWKIAQRFQTTTSILENLNPLINPDILYPGEVIQIPSTVVANPASTTSSNSSTASSNSTASSTNSAPSKASAIIATAKGFLGTPMYGAARLRLALIALASFSTFMDKMASHYLGHPQSSPR